MGAYTLYKLYVFLRYTTLHMSEGMKWREFEIMSGTALQMGIVSTFCVSFGMLLIIFQMIAQRRS